MMTLKRPNGLGVLWPSMVFLAVFCVVYLAGQYHEIIPAETIDADYARYLREHKQLYPTAEYPPLQGILLHVLAWVFNDEPQNFLIPLRLACLGVSLIYTFKIAEHFTGSDEAGARQWIPFTATLYAVLDPYLLWTAYLSRDFALAHLCLTVTAYYLVSAIQQGDFKAFRFLLMVLISIHIRIALIFPISGFALCVGVLGGWRKGVKAIDVVLLCALVLLTSNYLRFGHATLSSSAGFNLFLGNNPAYFFCHPNFDIDECLDGYAKQRVAESANHENTDPAQPGLFATLDENTKSRLRVEREFARSKTLTERAMDNIKGDVYGFAERLTAKASWFLFGVNKVPMVTAGKAKVIDEGRVFITHHESIANTSWARALGGIVFTPYRISFLLMFWYLSLHMLIKRHHDMFLLPCLGYLSMLPVLVMTFPDTRFYLAEMSIAGTAACACVLTRLAEQGDSQLERMP